MKIRGQNFVYRFVSDFLDNRSRKPEEQFYIECQALTPKETEHFALALIQINKSAKNPEEAARKINKKSYDTVKSKIIKIVNLSIEGVGKITTFEDLHKYAASEVIGEISESIKKQSLLEAGDQRKINGTMELLEDSALTSLDIPGTNKIFKIYPTSCNNMEQPEEERVWFELDALTCAECESMIVEQSRCVDTYNVDHAAEEFNNSYENLVLPHLKAVGNLDVDGYGLVTGGVEFFREGPAEMINEIKMMVMSVTKLSQSDKKK